MLSTFFRGATLIILTLQAITFISIAAADERGETLYECRKIIKRSIGNSVIVIAIVPAPRLCPPNTDEASSFQAIIYPNGNFKKIQTDNPPIVILKPSQESSSPTTQESSSTTKNHTSNTPRYGLAFGFAIIGLVITLVGFGLASMSKSKFISFFIKIAALLAGFYSMPALQMLMNVKGTSMAGAYWAYMLMILWWLSKVFGAETKGGSLAWLIFGLALSSVMIKQSYG
jgi:hypothetical protein